MTAALRGSIVTLLVTVMIAVALAAPRADAQSTTVAPTTAAGATTAPPTTVVRTGDTASSRTVNRIVLALLALAGLLLALTLWLWRSTKPRPVHLDALDAMGSRRWQRGSTAARAAMLAPVHERRGEIREEDLIAEPEPIEMPASASEVVDTPPLEDSPEPADEVEEAPAAEPRQIVGTDAVALGPTVDRHG
jgi:hypothetical protein